MGICKLCGQKYSFWDSTGTGMCLKCVREQEKKDAEERKARTQELQAQEKERQTRTQEKADILLPRLLDKFVPGQKASLLAAIFWADARTSLGNLRDKAMRATFVDSLGLGGYFAGPLMSSVLLFLHYGVVALAEKELILIEMGTADPKEVNMETFENAAEAKIKRYAVEDLKGAFNRQYAVLSLLRTPDPTDLVFPPSLGIKNPDKGLALSRVLGIRECPHCQASYNVQEYSAAAPSWKCSACRGVLPKEP